MLIENSITTPQPLLTLFACPLKFIIVQDIAREKGFPFHLSSHAIKFMCFNVTLILTQFPQQTIVAQDRLIIEVGSVLHQNRLVWLEIDSLQRAIMIQE